MQPQYPDQARAANIEGKIRIEVTINPEGDVVEARIVQGLGHGLDEAALVAMKRTKFHPSTKCGKPVATTIVIPVNFLIYRGNAGDSGAPRWAIIAGARFAHAQTGGPNETPTRQGKLTKPPKLVQFVEAAYPESEKLAGRTASVIVQIAISDKGVVDDVAVVQSASPAFDAAALE